MKLYHIQETIKFLQYIVFQQIQMAGFDFSQIEDPKQKYNALFIESLRSYLCSYYGIYHPFQDIANQVFIPDGDENSFKVSDSVNVEFKKEQVLSDNCWPKSGYDF